jgi:hypothetical protein
MGIGRPGSSMRSKTWVAAATEPGAESEPVRDVSSADCGSLMHTVA